MPFFIDKPVAVNTVRYGITVNVRVFVANQAYCDIMEQTEFTDSSKDSITTQYIVPK